MNTDEPEEELDIQSLIDQLKVNNKETKNELSTKDQYGVPYTSNKFHLESAENRHKISSRLTQSH